MQSRHHISLSLPCRLSELVCAGVCVLYIHPSTGSPQLQKHTIIPSTAPTSIPIPSSIGGLQISSSLTRQISHRQLWCATTVLWRCTRRWGSGCGATCARPSSWRATACSPTSASSSSACRTSSPTGAAAPRAPSPTSSPLTAAAPPPPPMRCAAATTSSPPAATVRRAPRPSHPAGAASPTSPASARRPRRTSASTTGTAPSPSPSSPRRPSPGSTTTPPPRHHRPGSCCGAGATATTSRLRTRRSTCTPSRRRPRRPRCCSRARPAASSLCVCPTTRPRTKQRAATVTPWTPTRRTSSAASTTSSAARTPTRCSPATCSRNPSPHPLDQESGSTPRGHGRHERTVCHCIAWCACHAWDPVYSVHSTCLGFCMYMRNVM
ncbi:uncharacterized protein LOC100274294 [Zea mays]|uniref:Uncharacterized protein n=1 Tax=Zea mays TaxID=4577 RepID=B4G025_MAIZE|nr:uncharacterized protein LOC100274294 [Zea mays]ACF87718.1 unknown [Zea mays]|eukprot:NP_001142130.1 uncharacterized protein LOC100274294 [Zea mays]